MADQNTSNNSANQFNNAASAALTANLLIIAAVTAIVGFAAFFASWIQASVDPGRATLQIAAKQYGLGNFRTAISLAEQVALPEDMDEESGLLREYVIGAGLVNLALPVSEVKERRALLHVAIPHLRAAAPPVRERAARPRSSAPPARLFPHPRASH